MKIQRFNELKKKYCICDDTEDVFEFVSDLLHQIALETKENEPYAVNTIKSLENASTEVWKLTNYIYELEEE